MRFLFLTALAAGLLSTSPANAQAAPERHSAVRIVADAALKDRLAAAGIGLDHAHAVRAPDGLVLHTVVSAADRARLDRAGVAYTVEVEDLAAAYDARPKPSAARLAQAEAEKRVDGFGYGSMGGYYTLSEVEAKLDEMAADYPDLITPKASIGQSHEGREIWQVWISDNPGEDEGEPEVLYTALHHAREPNSMAAVVYYMFYLLENYGTDPEVTYLVDNRRMAFVPVVNPDGYAYNELTDPDGGGFWRKNRRDNGDGTFGVDLNRNYGYEWGHDDSGSAPFTDAQTYRGPGPFSEPETQAIRDLAIGQSFRTAFNYHTYSNLLLYPWSYVADLATPDAARFAEYAGDMTQYNGYTAGSDVLYLVNGGSDDWMYGETTEKAPIISFLPEVGTLTDGFWPEQDRIFELCEENRYPNLRLAWYAGGTPALDSGALVGLAGDGLDPGEPARLQVEVRNAGLGPLDVGSYALRDTSGAFEILPGAPAAALDLQPDETATLSFDLRARPEATLGLTYGLTLSLAIGGLQVDLPVGPVAIGTKTTLASYDGSSLGGWGTDGWGRTDDAFSPPWAFTDSPDGFPFISDNRLELSNPIDLTEAAGPILRFRAKWDTNPRTEAAYVSGSTNGSQWTPLRGRFTRRGGGSGLQMEGRPGYSGQQPEWVEEQVDLRAYEGASSFYLQFWMRSTLDDFEGFTVDDIEVAAFVDGSGVAAEPVATADVFALYPPAPNPASQTTLVTFSKAELGPARLSVYDVLGREVAVLAEGERPAGRQQATVQAGVLAPGVYVIRLRSAGRTATQKLTVTR
jgi:hypothetical protein